MALVIEDGTIVGGADSLATTTELETYATNRGYTIVGDPEVLLRIANDQLWSFNFKGSLVDSTQGCPFPRENLVVYGETVAEDTIPAQAKKGQMELAIAIDMGNDLMAPQTNNAVSSASAGPLSVTFKTGQSPTEIVLPAVLNALKPLLASNGNGTRFRVRPTCWR